MNVFKQLIAAEKGVSLVMVMVTLGAVVGGSFYYTKTQQVVSQQHGKTRFNDEIDAVAQVIQTHLTRSANCTVTLAGKNPGDSIEIKTTKEFQPDYPEGNLDYFKPTGGETFLAPGQEIGRRITVEKIEFVANHDFYLGLNEGEKETMDAIRVTFKGVSPEIAGPQDLSRFFAIRGEKEGSSYKFCYSEPVALKGDILAQQALKDTCQNGFRSSVAGDDGVSKFYCNLTTLPKCTLTESDQCSAKVYYKESAGVSVQRRTRTIYQCTTRYKRKCLIGGSAFTRTCTCNVDPTIPTCSCSNGPAPTCYAVDWNKCEQQNTYTTVSMSKCCRRPLPLTDASLPVAPPDSSSGGSSGGSSSGGTGDGCFVAGTRVTMVDGSYKNIEDVLTGDRLDNGAGGDVSVLKLLRYRFQGKLYGINGGRPFFTPNHPFLTLAGWKSLDPVKSSLESGIRVGLLREGDILVRSDGGLEPLYILHYQEGDETVYNFNVSGNHQYVADDYVVHNLVKPPSDGTQAVE